MFLARIISYISNPLIIMLPTPFLLVDKVSNNDIYALKWTIFSYVFIGMVALFVTIEVLFRIFSDFDISKKEQRPIFFSFVGLITFFYLLALFVLNGPKILFVAVFAAMAGLIAMDIVNKWIKASVHVAAISAFILSLGIIYGGLYMLGLLIVPLIAWSRVKTKKHTPMEALAGGTVGILVTIIVYIISKQFLF